MSKLSTDIRLEIACFQAPAAVNAVSAGAHRIELCSSYRDGGITARHNDLETFKKNGSDSSIPVRVMIRERPGIDFTVNDHELVKMKHDIETLKDLADGFVFGVLDDAGNIDENVSAELVKTAHPRPCTFHRAFDHANGSLERRLETIRRCGFASILSSGGQTDAILNQQTLQHLVALAESMAIEIIVGGGVRSSNIVELIRGTGAKVYHTAAIRNGDELDPNMTAEIRSIRDEIAKAASKSSASGGVKQRNGAL